MESYKKLSFTFKEMLKRIKVMRVRLKIRGEEINKIFEEPLLNNEQFRDMQLEYDGISMSLEYLKPEIIRTIIMLKICLYKQKIETIASTTNTVGQNLTSNHDHKTTLIPTIESQHSNEIQIHTISSECESNIRTWETQYHGSSNWTSTEADIKLIDKKLSVNLKNCLTTFSKFTGKRIFIRVGVG